MERRQRNPLYEATLRELARMDTSVWEAALQTITQADAAALEVHRVGVWLFSKDRSEIVCENLYDAREDRHEKGTRLRAEDYPRYFEALSEKRLLAADDARTDPDTSEFTESYLKPLGITAMLDVPVWHRGEVAGILCHEHTGQQQRQWTIDEQEFAASVAEAVALALEAARRQYEVRESEERFKSAFERSSIGMAIVGLDDRYLQVNRAFCALFGYSSEEMLTFTTASVSHPDDLRGLRKTNDSQRRVMSGEIESFQVEKRYRHKQGHYFWGLVGVSLVRDAEGNPLHFISQVQDITERKQAEEALRRAHDELEARVAERTAALIQANAALQAEIDERERAEEARWRSEQQFRLVVENASDVITILDAETGVIRYQSPAAERIFGYPSQEMVGSNAFSYFHPDDIAHTAAVLAQVVQNPGLTGSAEFRFRHKDGSYTDCESVGRTLLPDSTAAGVVVNTRDISERKRAAAALRESEARSSAVIQHALDCVITINHEGRVVEFNPAAEATFGYTRAEALGQDLNDLIVPPAFHEAHNRGIAHYLRTGEGPVLNKRIEVPALRKDGAQITVELAATAIPLSDSPLFTAYLRDITDRKQAEEALRQAKEEAEAANQAKSEFLSRMSHELRTPMNSILGFAQLLARRALAPEQSRSVDHILKAGRHLLGLINEVLDIARIEANQAQFSLEPVRVGSVVQEAINLIQPLAAQRGCRIDGGTALESDQYVLADRQRLTQVLLNLLSNAVKYNRAGGSVSLFSEIDTSNAATRANLRIGVRDTGQGIAPEKMARLFIPFERLGAEQSDVEGTGLGLALSRRLVEAMGGALTAESVAGEGSVFTVALALVESPLERLERSGGGPGAAGTPGEVAVAAPENYATLLYIEDNLANLSLIETILSERAGVTLLSALQGRLGLDLALEHQPDLILLDLHLPDMPGDEVLKRLQSHPSTRDIPVIVISADATPGSITRLLKAGAQGYLTKPLDVEQFLKTIDEILEKEPAGGSLTT